MKRNIAINTKIPFFLWRMEEREAEIHGDTIITKKMVDIDEQGTQQEETYTNHITKSPWWMVGMIKYLPILLILVTADWGVQLWNGIGLFFASLYMFWYFWMQENKPNQFYPVTIGSIVVLLVGGFLSGTLLYANHIVSDVIYLFLIKMLIDDYLFKNHERFYKVDGKVGMFVYFKEDNQYSDKWKYNLNIALIGLAAIALVITVINGAMAYNEYRKAKQIEAELEVREKQYALDKNKTRAVLVQPTHTQEKLTDDQILLRQQLEIGGE